MCIPLPKVSDVFIMWSLCIWFWCKKEKLCYVFDSVFLYWVQFSKRLNVDTYSKQNIIKYSSLYLPPCTGGDDHLYPLKGQYVCMYHYL